MFIPRNIVKSIEKIASKYPIIALTGPRQSGKTTLLKTMFPAYRYISLENPDTRQFAETDPRGFLNQYNSHVIFDEVQRVPHLFSYIQTVVDNSRMMGQFVFSGSQNFHLMQNITQSLAGRVAIFRLFPFDFEELKNVELLERNYMSLMLKGFYPAIYDRDIPPADYYPNYIDTYIQRDVSELIAVQDKSLFQKFLAICATRAGQILNMSAIAKECGISVPTVKAWMSALENSYILFLLYPYHKNFTKRIVKSPKLYFYDTGLLSNLLKINDVSKVDNQSIKGALFENMIVSEYVKQIHHKNERMVELWYWRDSHGNEVDLLLEKPQGIEVIEVKATATITSNLFKGLNYFSDISNIDNLEKTLVYGGTENQYRSTARVLSWKNLALLSS